MKNLLTVKSSEESSDLVRAHASRPYNKLDMHLLLTNCRITSSEAIAYLQFYQKLHLLNDKMLFCYSIICYETYIQLFFCVSQLLTSHDF